MVPAARRHGVVDPNISYTVSVAEGGEQASLRIDASRLAKAGIDLMRFQDYVEDEIASALLRRIISHQSVVKEGIMTCTVG